VTAPTHLSLGGLAYLAGCAFVDRQPQVGELAMVGLGSLLPDVDTPRSWLGKLFLPLSKRIERRFGHRTITHSFVGLLLVAVLALPLVPTMGIGPWVALLIGTFAHLLGDMCTKQGIQFYWPMAVWGVFPMKEPYRLATGSRMEGAVLALSLLANLAVAPVATAGTSRTLHYLNRSAYGAIDDYYELGPGRRTYLHLEGVVAGSERRIAGRFPVVGGLTRASLLVDLDSGLAVVGVSGDSQVKAQRMWLETGERVVRPETVLRMDGRLLRELAPLQQREHRLFGRLRYFGEVDLRTPPWEFSPVHVSGGELVLEYATFADLERLDLLDVAIVGSALLVAEVVQVEERYVPFSLAPASGGLLVLEFEVGADTDVLVTPGQRVQKGDLLAENSVKARRISLLEAELQSERELRVQANAVLDGELALLADRLAAKRGEIRRLQRIAAAYREHADLGFDAAEVEREIEEVELSAAGLEQAILELRTTDDAHQIEYEQRVARLAAEVADVRAEASLRAATSGRIVMIQRGTGRRVLFGLARSQIGSGRRHP
jgi:inner membrane protein